MNTTIDSSIPALDRTRELGELLCASFERFSALNALWLAGEAITYQQLFRDAGHLARSFLQMTNPQNRIGILAQRSYPAYVGILASVLSNRSYVPINPKFPVQRQAAITSAAGCSLVVFDENSRGHSNALAESLPSKPRQITATKSNAPSAAEHLELACMGTPSDTAYIMFTSGTTGAPKGIAVCRDNLSAYLSAIEKIAPIAPGTRCTQLFDLSFDLSVHDIFQTWVSGGCLYVMANEDVIDPVGFARKHGLQAWFSVPSLVTMAARMRQLEAGCLPELRLSLFCGEALPVSIAKQWADAAPNSRILNLYGPTEATIAITAREFSPKFPSEGATVPLGEAFPGSGMLIMGEDLQPTLMGELWLGGPQVSRGYLNNDQANRDKFVHREVPGSSINRWYRSGDLVRRTEHGELVFVGRIDDQAKIQGYRVELLEIEEAIRQASGSSEVAAVLWPLNESGAAEGVVGFICASSGDAKTIITACRARLPAYAAPRKILFVNELPLNANGKVDRNALRARHL